MKSKELKPPTGATNVCPLVFIKSPEWIKAQTGFNSPGTSYWIEDTELSVFSPWRVTCCPEQYHLHFGGKKKKKKELMELIEVQFYSERFCRRRLVTLVYHLSACFNARPGLWRRLSVFVQKPPGSFLWNSFRAVSPWQHGEKMKKEMRWKINTVDVWLQPRLRGAIDWFVTVNIRAQTHTRVHAGSQEMDLFLW